jgi:hypothetical protein
MDTPTPTSPCRARTALAATALAALASALVAGVLRALASRPGLPGAVQPFDLLPLAAALAGPLAFLGASALSSRGDERRRLVLIWLASLASLLVPLALLLARRPAALPGLLGGLVLGAAIGGAAFGIALRSSRGGLLARLRFLLFPQVALVVVISEMAYLRLVPLRLLHFPFADKVMHFLLFGAVVFWLDLFLAPRAVRLGFLLRRVPLSIAIAFSVAGLDELVQAFSSSRSAELGDLASDLAGMLLFLVLSRRLSGRRSRGSDGDRAGDEPACDSARGTRYHPPRRKEVTACPSPRRSASRI